MRRGLQFFLSTLTFVAFVMAATLESPSAVELQPLEIVSKTGVHTFAV